MYTTHIVYETDSTLIMQCTTNGIVHKVHMLFLDIKLIQIFGLWTLAKEALRQANHFKPQIIMQRSVFLTVL